MNKKNQDTVERRNRWIPLRIKILQALQATNTTQTALAEHIGLRRHSLTRALTMETSPTHGNMDKLETWLNDSLR